MSRLVWALVACSALGGGLASCSSPGQARGFESANENAGGIGLALTLFAGERIDTVSYNITGPNGYTQSGTLDVSNSSVIAAVIGGIPAGIGYTIVLTATAADGGTSTCMGTATFDVVAGITTTVPITIECIRPRRTGSVFIDGIYNECPNIDTAFASAGKAFVGSSISLTSSASDGDHGPAPLSYAWTATFGTFSTPSAPSTTYTCTAVGSPVITLKVSDGDPDPTCADSISMQPICLCALPSDCPGSDTACRSRTCTAGVCGFAFVPAGPAAMQTAGDCHSNRCDGAGNLVSLVDNADVPVDGKACTQDICTAGEPSNPAVAYGTTCSENGGQICSGDGSCVPITFDVVRLGDGVTTLSGTMASALFIEQRKLDGTLVGAPIAMPTAGNGGNLPLVTTGTAATEAMLSRSVDGRFLTMTGYGVPPGFVDPVGSASAPRVVGRIDAARNVDTTTVLASTAFVAGAVRTAATVDGSNFWVGGVGTIGGGGGSTGGIWYIPRGTIGGKQLSGAPARVLDIFGGQLLGTGDASLHLDVFQVGSGLPTAGVPVVTGLAGMPTTGMNPFGFVFFDIVPGVGDPTLGGMDTAYVADSGSNANGIERWSYSNATAQWSLVKTMNIVPANAFRGLAGLVTGTSVTLVASTAGMATNRVVVFVDDGSPSPVGTIVATGSTTVVYRGVALPPHN